MSSSSSVPASAAAAAAARALIVVDVQNDYFGSEGGALPCADADEILAPISAAAADARAFGTVVVTQDAKPAASAWGEWPPHCIEGTRGQALHAGLAVPAGALRVGKADTQSAFGPRPAPGAPPPPSPLAEALRARGVREVVVCGLALEYCVLSTALGAADARFERVTVVVREASRAFDATAARASPRSLADRAEEKARETGVRVRFVDTFAEALAAEGD
jgi:nicotinamidase/pyrazinamidase